MTFFVQTANGIHAVIIADDAKLATTFLVFNGKGRTNGWDAVYRDVGFDPLGFAKNKEDLLNYREAEIKHARLAMLAAAGWPLSELFGK